MIKRLLWLALLPLSAQAADDFAQQWPLQLSQPDAGAYRVPLDASVYAAAHWRDLRDVRVIDADGKQVASAVYAAAMPLSGPLRTVELQWFALPVAATADDDLSVVVERDTRGKVLSIRNSVGSGGSAGAAAPVWLVDLGDDAGKVRALRVDWADAGASLDLGYRLEGSDDLRGWQVLDPQVRLVQLSNQGRELRNSTIKVDSALRYLRLVPLQRTSAPALRALRGEVVDAVDSGDWQWLELTAAAGGSAKDGYQYQLQGRPPIQRMDVRMPANSAVSWSVFSRDADRPGADGNNPDWQLLRRGWNAWSLSEAGQLQHSPPLETSGVITDRQWRLLAEPGSVPSEAPLLRLGYRPGSMVFLAQGRAPYLLVAGSANVSEMQVTLDPMLDALRARNGAQWQPAIATLGGSAARAGDAAYQPAKPPRDWKNVLLWAVLVIGALAVAGFALSLLRSSRVEKKEA
ncbi:hypothetical protein ABB26_06445 [Stenotrophomonas humi]|uniref:DUF3999 domain-containing protein n=1 Tax=Stenotrophomonas humi TaxID=405444 RepID=A0A0R0C5V8_9GAMM|nr:DUF3999 family protein [Stenotrophomonas humi]KRG64667.1 hypothetical protein ABB26_06445 [Stenotrophomonas humi]